MTSKTYLAYKDVFGFIKEKLAPLLNPSVVFTDFEKALNALKNNKKISKDRKLQYLLQDIAIKKATISLDEEEISVREFLEKTCKHTFNPARTSLYEPRRPLKRKRPMPAQNEDSDSV
jgi:hypothetical protein